MRRNVFQLSLPWLLAPALAGLCAAQQATKAERQVFPIVYGHKGDGLPRSFTARGTISRVDYAPPHCGELIFPATLKVRLDGKVDGYRHPFLYLVVPCLYQPDGAEKFLNQRIEITVAKLDEKVRPCFFDIKRSAIDSGGVPFYCAKREELLRALLPDRLSSPTVPIEFAGTLEKGITYRALVVRERAHDWRTLLPLKIPFHHAARIEWLNLKDYPALDKSEPGSRAKQLVFTVVRRETIKVAGQYRWNTTYYCRIVAVES